MAEELDVAIRSRYILKYWRVTRLFRLFSSNIDKELVVQERYSKTMRLAAFHYNMISDR